MKNVKTMMKRIGAIALFATAGIFGLATQGVNEAEKEKTKSIDVLFKKSKLIEVAFLSVRPDKQKQLKESYFKKVFPIAKEYGLKPLAKIKVQYSYSDFVQPQIIGFFEWESEEKHAAFLKDKRFLKLKPLRDEALSFLRLGYFTVNEDTEVSFKSGELVEIFSIWFNPENAHRMQTYFKNVMPLITGKNNPYDVKFPVSFNSVKYGDDTYQPQSFGMAFWKNKASNDAFFSSDDYAKIKHDKEAAISKLDVWHGQVIIE